MFQTAPTFPRQPLSVKDSPRRGRAERERTAAVTLRTAGFVRRPDCQADAGPVGWGVSEHRAELDRWLWSGREYFPAVREAIRAARESVRLEVYIFEDDGVGRALREELRLAAERGVAVKVLVDALGSALLPAGFWAALEQAGGEVRIFNPPLQKLFGHRDHRKMVVCDGRVALVGGFNYTADYAGDGRHQGWKDLGLRTTRPVATELAAAFDAMYERAGPGFRHRRRRRARPNGPTGEPADLLLSGPGHGRNPFRQSLMRDLARAREVRIIAAYFLPPARLRRELVQVVRRGGRVRLILPGRSDVAVSQLAARSLYRRLLRAGVEIHEYQPQVLHAKLVVLDQTVYVGSANLDPRSLSINYELMVRRQDARLAAEAANHFDELLPLCRHWEVATWARERNWWDRVRQRLAHFLLSRVDPVFVRWRMNRLYR